MIDQEVAAKLYHELNVAMSQHGFSIRDILNICSNVISDNVQCSSERENNLTNALWESFNIEPIKYHNNNVWSYAQAICLVFPKGLTTHSPFQKQNYEAYKTAFLALEEDDKKFLIEKYPGLKILGESNGKCC